MKIAFLFLTLDNTNQPELWKKYFKNNKDKYNIYCHPKNPDKVTDSFLKNNIVDIQKTDWSHVIEAEVSLYKEALKDKDNIYFMLVSESCIPTKTFEEFYSFLFDNKNTQISYIKEFGDTKEKVKYWRRKHNMDKLFNSNYRFVHHSTWYCISRHHVKKILVHPDLKKFEQLHIGSEFFFSMLCPDKLIKNYPITYADWGMKTKSDYINVIIENMWKVYDFESDPDKKRIIQNDIKRYKRERMDYGLHPKTFTHITKEDIKNIKKSRSFFWRKFSKESDISKYLLL